MNGFVNELMRMKTAGNAAFGDSSNNPIARPAPVSTGARPSSMMRDQRTPTSYSVVHRAPEAPRAGQAVLGSKMVSPPPVV